MWIDFILIVPGLYVAQASLPLAGLIILTSNKKYFHLQQSSALAGTCRQKLQPQPHSRHSLIIIILSNEVINNNISIIL